MTLPSAAAAGGPTAAPRILVVDDDDAVRRSVTRAMRFEGFVVTAAESAEEALDLIACEGGDFDVIISDIMMRGMSGIAFCDQVQRANASTRVILISGFPGTHFADEALAVGRFDLLQKPFTPTQLAARVRQALAGGATP